jgi:hypothetical protein
VLARPIASSWAVGHPRTLRPPHDGAVHSPLLTRSCLPSPRAAPIASTVLSGVLVVVVVHDTEAALPRTAAPLCKQRKGWQTAALGGWQFRRVAVSAWVRPSQTWKSSVVPRAFTSPFLPQVDGRAQSGRTGVSAVAHWCCTTASSLMGSSRARPRHTVQGSAAQLDGR